MKATKKSILEELSEQELKIGSLPVLLEFFKKLVEIQTKIEEEIRVPRRTLNPESIRTKIIQGNVLLKFEDLRIDLRQLDRAFKEIASLYKDFPVVFSAIPERFLELDISGPAGKDMVKTWYEGRIIQTGLPAENGDYPLVMSIVSAAMNPFLSVESAGLQEFLEPERWRRGYCPVCGGNPDFAYIAEDTSARWLVCSRCDTEWLFQRLQCPFCGNYNQNTLSFFTDESNAHRLYVCDNCHHYLKAADLRQLKIKHCIPLERINTLDLDRQAREKGYIPAGLNL